MPVTQSTIIIMDILFYPSFPIVIIDLFAFCFLIFQLWTFYFILVLLQSPIVMEMNRGTHVSQSPTVRCKASRFRAMRAQPFTDKLIRNICDGFSVYLSEHLCAYLCVVRRVIFLYICY